MCSSRAGLLVSLVTLAGLSCRQPQVVFVVHRGAAPVSYAPGTSDGADGIAEPARPYLDRYDLLHHFHADVKYPSDFVDYIRPQPIDFINTLPRTWWGNRHDQLAAAEKIVAGRIDPRLPTRDCANHPAPCRKVTQALAVGTVACQRPGGCVGVWLQEEMLDGYTAADLGGGAVDVAFFTKAVQPGTTERRSVLVLDAAPPAPAAPGSVVLYAVPTISEALLSFYDLSDVHIREATATLGTPQQSHGLDHVIDSFERDFDQVLYTDVLLQALVSTMNSTIRDGCGDGDYDVRRPLDDPARCPMFVVHTGDAVDAGLRSEFDIFHRIMDGLRVPWLSVVGNHDVLTFGNFIPDTTITTQALVLGAKNAIEDEWYWKYGLRWASQARWAVQFDDDCGGCSDELLASGGTYDASKFIARHSDHMIGTPQMTFGNDPAVTTRNHGFDRQDSPHGAKAGYYAFDVNIAGGYRLRAIMINTSDFSEAKSDRGGEGGYLSDTQLDWLDQKLHGLGDHQLALVFGHSPMETIRNDGCKRYGPGCRDRLETILAQASEDHHLIAYICGHEHRERVDLIEHGGHAFWEIETGSLVAFPQEARRITLRKLDDRVGFLELLPFSYSVTLDGATAFRRALAQEQRGAKRDYCARNPCTDGEPPRDGRHGAVRAFFEFPPIRTSGGP